MAEVFYVSGRQRTTESKFNIITGVYTNRIFNELLILGKRYLCSGKETCFLL
jgi:hypothetical protein